MTAQDLSLEELEICAGLYSGTDSVLFTTKSVMLMANGTWSIFDNSLKMWRDTNSFWGVWYGRTAYILPQRTIQPLVDRGLLIPQEEDKQKYYILNVSEKFKEFFKELKVQIALGSI